MDSTDQAALNKAVQDALTKLQGTTPPVVTPATTGMDLTKVIGIFATLALVLTGWLQQQLKHETAPLPAPAPVVTPLDPTKDSLVADVADLKARVKVLETPVKK
jgi:hypothetical protein